VAIPVSSVESMADGRPGGALIRALAQVIRDAMEADALNTIGSEFAGDRPTIPAPNATITPDDAPDDHAAA